jgi:hypothetical protein
VLAEKHAFLRTYHRNFQDAISYSYSLASIRPSWERFSPPSPEVGEEFLRNVVYLRNYFNRIVIKSSRTSILIKSDLQWILVIRFFHHKKVSICTYIPFVVPISILWIHKRLLCFEVCLCFTKYSDFSFWSPMVITSWSSLNVLRQTSDVT